MLPARTARLLFLFLTLTLGILLLWPLVSVVGGAFFDEGHFTLKWFAGVFRNPIYAEGLINSLKLALGTTALACAISIPLAWLANTWDFPGKRAFSSLLLVPMILPPFVGAIGVQQMFGPYGAVNTLLGCGAIDWLGKSGYWGVVVLQALCFYPIVYLNVSAALANIDPALDEAAANLGAPPLTRLRKITLPMLAPGLFAGGTLVFVASFTELGTPLIMNYTRCAAVQVYDELSEISSSPFPYALVTVVLASSVLLYFCTRLLAGRKRNGAAKASTRNSTPVLKGWRGALLTLPFLATTLLALLPHIGVVLTSFSPPGAWYQSIMPKAFTMANYTEALGHSMVLGAIRNSILFSLLAVLADIALGVGVAWIAVRSTLKFRWLPDALAMIPLAVPGLVMAFGYVAVSGTLSSISWIKEIPALANALDIRTNPTIFLAIAYAVRRLPYMARSCAAGLEQTPASLEEAAANLGAKPSTVLRRITAPLLCANIVAGGLLVFSFSMLEVSDSLLLAQKMEFYPITKTIFELFQLIGTGKHLASALGVWAMAFLAATLIGAGAILGKKLGAMFRA